MSARDETRYLHPYFCWWMTIFVHKICRRVEPAICAKMSAVGWHYLFLHKCLFWGLLKYYTLYLKLFFYRSTLYCKLYCTLYTLVLKCTLFVHDIAHCPYTLTCTISNRQAYSFRTTTITTSSIIYCTLYFYSFINCTVFYTLQCTLCIVPYTTLYIKSL